MSDTLSPLAAALRSEDRAYLGTYKSAAYWTALATAAQAGRGQPGGSDMSDDDNDDGTLPTGIAMAWASYDDASANGSDSDVYKAGARFEAEIAAAIEAARAAGEKAGRDAGVAIGAANMRETCAGTLDARCLDASAGILRALALPSGATAILAAERAAGREEMRVAIRKKIGTVQDKSWDGCKALGSACPETGARECSLASRGKDCLCQHAYEAFDPLITAIDALVLP